MTAPVSRLQGVKRDHRISDALGDYRTWLYRAATGILGPGSDFLDDLAQEGYIAMWRAAGTHDPRQGALPAWLTLKARYRMIEVAGRRNWTGRPARRDGRSKISDGTPVSLDAEYGNGVTLAELVAWPELIDRVELAYHHGEILRAISRLSPQQRKYVLARFWYRMSHSEMAKEIFGYDPSALWTSPRNGARQKLAAALAHLENV
jgi:RNA polymerase sigma factor (sigma-70 family)